MNTYSTCSYGIIFKTFSALIRTFRSSKVNVDSGNESYGRDIKPDWNVSEMNVTAESKRALKPQTCGKVSRKSLCCSCAVLFYPPTVNCCGGCAPRIKSKWSLVQPKCWQNFLLRWRWIASQSFEIRIWPINNLKCHIFIVQSLTMNYEKKSHNFQSLIIVAESVCVCFGLRLRNSTRWHLHNYINCTNGYKWSFEFQTMSSWSAIEIIVCWLFGRVKDGARWMSFYRVWLACRRT